MQEARCPCCFFVLLCFISNTGSLLQSPHKGNFYIFSTKSPCVFDKSGLAASLIKGRIFRVGTRQNLGQIWLNREGSIFLFFLDFVLYLPSVPSSLFESCRYIEHAIFKLSLKGYTWHWVIEVSHPLTGMQKIYWNRLGLYISFYLRQWLQLLDFLIFC